MPANTFARTISIFVILVSISGPTSSDREIRNRSNSIVKRRFTDSFDDMPIPTQSSTGCGSCKIREEIKTRNLEVIKGEVLRRMGFESAPNVTGRDLPPVPDHFLERVDLGTFGGMLSDEPEFKTGYSITEEEDDYHIKTQEVLTFAQPCKHFFFINYSL